MQEIARVFVALIAITLLATACGGGNSGTIAVQDASFRLTPNDLGAGYLTVTNTTNDAVTLEGASADGFGRIELHETMNNGGVVAMEARPDGFTIEPGETVSLEPGGKHLMLFEPEVSGGDVMIDLDFGAETISVVATFDEAGSALATDDHGDHDAEGDDHGDHDAEGDDHGADS